METYLIEIKAYVHTKTYLQILIVALFLIAPKDKQVKCPLTAEWINKLWYIHPRLYYLVQRSELFIQVTT